MRAGASLIVLLFVALFAAGCAEVPQAEIDSAMSAYALAEKAETEVYASAAWRELQDAKAALDTELEAQAANSGVSTSYVDAQDLAAKMQSAAEYAHKEAQKGKERVKVEYSTFLGIAENTLAMAEEKVSDIRRVFRGRDNYDERMAVIEAAKVTLEEAVVDYTEGRFWDAREKVRLLPESLAVATEGLD
jgi:hypothetical protein